MFKNAPKILGHISCLQTGNFVLNDYILNKSIDGVNLFHRYCPHRMYPLHQTGEIVDEIFCKFHGFKWDKNGKSINNSKNIACGKADVGKSGLIFKNFMEPNHEWIQDIKLEKNLKYSHCFTGKSKGSYLWLMDAEADLLHLYKDGIHPFLSKQINLENIKMQQGNDWILQEHPNGWWLYIFPYSFIEYGRPGMLMINRVTPHDENSEYGFDWITQFYYDDSVDCNNRMIFETLENVFKEDVLAIEKQKGKYFPLMKSTNKYEDHCVHFGQWVMKNKE